MLFLCNLLHPTAHKLWCLSHQETATHIARNNPTRPERVPRSPPFLSARTAGEKDVINGPALLMFTEKRHETSTVSESKFFHLRFGRHFDLVMSPADRCPQAHIFDCSSPGPSALGTKLGIFAYFLNMTTAGALSEACFQQNVRIIAQNINYFRGGKSLMHSFPARAQSLPVDLCETLGAAGLKSCSFKQGVVWLSSVSCILEKVSAIRKHRISQKI